MAERRIPLLPGQRPPQRPPAGVRPITPAEFQEAVLRARGHA